MVRASQSPVQATVTGTYCRYSLRASLIRLFQALRPLANLLGHHQLASPLHRNIRLPVKRPGDLPTDRSRRIRVISEIDRF